MVHRRALRRIVIALIAFIGASATLVLLTLFNPFHLIFQAEFSVKNESGTTVHITPLGIAQGSGRKVLLPMYRGKGLPAFPSREKRELRIAANAARQFVYDWDDVNLCWILVRGERGSYRLMRTGLSEDPSDCCTGPDRTTYVIPNLERLPRAPRELVVAAGLTSAR